MYLAAAVIEAGIMDIGYCFLFQQIVFWFLIVVSGTRRG